MLNMGSPLTKAAAVDFGIQWSCWAVAAALKTEKFYDLAGKSYNTTPVALGNERSPKILVEKTLSMEDQNCH